MQRSDLDETALSFPLAFSIGLCYNNPDNDRLRGSDKMLPMTFMALVDEDDIPAFEELYNTYRSKMFGIALAVLGDAHDAEDAVAEAFYHIARDYKKIMSLDCKKREGYIVILCRNAAFDIYRRRKRETEHIAGDIETASLSFEDEDSGRLTQAIRALPKEHRDALYIYCIFGCSAEESAARLGISKGALYTRVSRAKAELKRLLKEGEGGE